MLRATYDWALRRAESPYALWLLALISFLESSVFPIPPDILLIPMVLARPHRAWLIAGVCTLASVLGGFAGYAIGLFLFDTVGQPVLAFYGYLERFTGFQALYNEWGAWIVAGAGVTPFPYKVITIASGVTALDPWVFGIASVLSRGVRFFLVAALLWKWGDPMRAVIERRLGLLVTLGFVLLVGGFAALKLL
ncbi:YqaA family protein [Roseospira visakhapatnamensis]|uniref:Membrane protein YqaA with SNARE-associated domain n=1 Tax=Roseospira visakhapatnamensis TaxID=390880 RepID=A0A7W6RB83_9PROT|nr:YqaA family protein [Roseospira visakhapatnamensis]MBB4264734.1 membrane protein YqaA with SNARE-associated domain [Roseospira visakhapatnamensis]